MFKLKDNLDKSDLELQNIKKIVSEAEVRSQNILAEKIKQVYDGQFANLEIEFNHYSSIWLGRLKICIIVLFAYLFIPLIATFTNFLNFLWFIHIPANLTLAAIINTIILSALSWLIFFFSKNYSINKNLEYIYKQKHTTLDVYLPYADSFSEVGVVKDKVTAELGKIVFDIPSSGFIKHDGSTNDNSPSIINNIFDKLK